MSVIYQPSGRAREYAEWACNLFTGCPHGCAYCFAPSCLFMKKYEFHKGAVPKKDILDRLREDAKAQPERRMVHLCFTCDPLPEPCSITRGDPWLITRHAINLLKDAGHGVQILSKGGLDSLDGLDLLDERDEYATTLTLDNIAESRLWEPFAASPRSRISALNEALSYGVITWASLEPVIYPEQSLNMLRQALEAGISKVKVGPLNYKGKLPKWLADTVPELDQADWVDFTDEVKRLCRNRAEVILKNDLKVLIGESGG